MHNETITLTNQYEFLNTLFNAETIANINIIMSELNKGDYGEWEDELDYYINIDELTIETSVLALKILHLFREPVKEYLLSKGIILEQGEEYSIDLLSKLVLVTTSIDDLGINDAIYLDGLINDVDDDEPDLLVLFLKIANYLVNGFDLDLLYNSIKDISNVFIEYTNSKILKSIAEHEISPSIGSDDLDNLSLTIINELSSFVVEYDIGNLDKIFKLLLLGVNNINVSTVKSNRVSLIKNIDFYLRELDEEDYVNYIKPKVVELLIFNILLTDTPLPVTIETLASLELGDKEPLVRSYLTDMFKIYLNSESYKSMIKIKGVLGNE